MTYDALQVIYPRWHLCRARLLREIKQGVELDVAWYRMQAIASAYQHANKIMFMALPAYEINAIKEWLKTLED